MFLLFAYLGFRLLTSIFSGLQFGNPPPKFFHFPD
jgi:hypothetical protein